MKDKASLQRCVTLVDDERSVLDFLGQAAQSFHFDSQTAGSAEDAVALLEKKLTPIVVTDLHMPGQGGGWLVQEIQRRWPQVGIIVITVGSEDDDLKQCLRAGVQHYFMKPIHVDEFYHALHSTWYRQLLRCEQHRHHQRLERIVNKQTHKLRRTFFSAITSLVRTIEARDAYTSGHSNRVRGYAMRLARYIGMDEHHQKRLSLAAKLHDIGKVGLAEGILNKPARLSESEFALVKEHPIVGERILKPIIHNREVLSAIRSHHERFDGAGYPDNLSSEEIPFLARMITVADCYDALTSSRAYRGALTEDDALGILSDGTGSQFDPQLIPPFVRMIRERN